MISNFGVADGGRETWAYHFIPRLLDRWPNVTLDVIGLHRNGEPDNQARLTELLGERGSVTFLLSNRRRFPVLSMLREAPSRLSPAIHPVPDLVIGVGSVIELLVILASPALRRARRVIWLRTILADERSKQLPGMFGRLMRALEVRLLRSADLLVANGDDTAAYYRARGLDISVIPNGVDVERWRSACPALERPIAVAFVGRLARVKGIDEFLTLAQRMHNGEFEFHVVGEGPFEAQVQKGHRDGWLVYHGSKANEDLPPLIAAMDACVALTFKSSQGGGGGVSNALLEQMAAGRVILAWRTAIYEQLLGEANAWLVPQADVDALERALNEILDRPEEARRRAENARMTAEEFSFDAHLDRFDALTRRLLSRRVDS